MIVLATVASVGMIVNFLIESVDAWHSQFSSKKECRNFIMDNLGNTS